MQRRLINTVLFISAATYTIIMVLLLFFVRRGGPGMVSSNFTPFLEIRRYLFGNDIPTRLVIINLLGNIVMFIPLGIYLRLLFRQKTALISIVLVAMTSVTVEFTQLYFALGSCDIDDVILNTIGGAVGVGLFALLERFSGTEERFRYIITFFAAACSIAAVTGWIYIY